MTIPRLLIVLCLLIVPVDGPGDVSAVIPVGVRIAAADEPALRAAKLHFERGEKLYSLTKFSEALDEYQKAFDAMPLADLLFNMGQCYRNLGDFAAATFSYKKYLTLAPDAPNRERVEQLIVELEAQQDQRDTHRLGLAPLRAPLPRPARPSPSRRPSYRTWWFWTSLGVVVTGASSVMLYEATRPTSPPPTRLGNIVFGE
ncbi:MAG: tetratricopeptide repeat protein [Myxococcales bacterium]|nr:tetratricopeptide repeat protein [Myxococcales bacterium]